MNTHYTDLKTNPELLNASISLIESSFHYQKPFSFKKDFWQFFETDNLENCKVALYDNQVISTIFLRPVTFNYQSIEVNSFFIGGISVTQEFRGKNIFKNFFNTVLDNYKHKAALYFLWSEKEDLFQKWDFYNFGVIYEKSSNETSVIEFNETKIDSNKLLQLYTDSYQNYIKPVRTIKDSEKILTHTTSTILEKEKSICFRGKGMDLKNIIFESYPQKMPYYPQNSIIWSLEQTDEVIVRYMGMMKIANFDLYNQFLKSISLNQISTSDNYNIVLNGESFDVSPIEHIQGIWGPNFFEETKAIIPTIYISGLDSL